MRLFAKKMYRDDGRDKLLPRFGVFVFDHARVAAFVWLVLAVFGLLSYTTLMRREGFPSIDIPYTVIRGAYLVNDPAKVDHDVAEPISSLLLKDSRVDSVQTQSRGTLFNIVVQYKSDSTDVAQANKDFEQRIKSGNFLPKQANFQIMSPKFGFTQRGDDAVISVYSTDQKVTASALKDEAQRLTGFMETRRIDGVKSISIIDPFTDGTDPRTGKTVQQQTKFDVYGVRQGNEAKFYPSVSVGIMQQKDSDVIKLDDRIQKALDDYNDKHNDDDFFSVVSASYAPDIKSQISELQRSLLEGLIAVLVVGSIVIAIRASLITVLSMLTVIIITVGILNITGFTLNTITLFSLVLCLGLVVDDTIIMVEAIDAQRRRSRDPREIIRTATQKISRAMVAATLTASLSFAPLLFVSGILGGFIRAIPITVIVSLLTSLTVALVFIPLFARFILLGKKQLGAEKVHEPAGRVEDAVARAVTGPMRWARDSRKRLAGVGLAAVLIGVIFVAAAGVLFQKVTFNIFPPSKDSNGLTATLQFDPGTTIAQAEAVSKRADDVIGKTLGDNFEVSSFYESATDQQASMVIKLKPYNERKPRSPELRDKLQAAFDDFAGAKVTVGQQDVGPPPSSFTVRIETDDRGKAFDLARDMRTYLYGRELMRASGTTAEISDVTVSDEGSRARTDGKAYVSVIASFDATDTSTLVGLARKVVQDHYDANELKRFGLAPKNLDYDIGQEQQNQDSFKTLALAFPVLLLAIYILLAVQFRSLLQPLLIFLAIPFSLFGITLGLYLTDNAFSFFAMLGFFALIGLSLKNTILLTDYANQLRRTGESAVDAAVGALRERFRPLIATSLTAVVSLIPLAIASPFWEGLAVVLIFGLLSSTFLVVTVFPYYYLGAEFMRLRVRRGPLVAWLLMTVGLSAAALAGKLPAWTILIAIALSTLVVATNAVEYRRTRRN